MTRTTLLLILSCLTLSAPAAAQRGPKRARAANLTPLYAAHRFSADGKTLPYRLMRPARLEAGRRYPLVICLHGSGGRGSDNLKNLTGTGAAAALARPTLRERYPCFAFVPQCPRAGAWRGRASEGRPDHIPLALAALDAVIARHDAAIDRRRIYVTGQSMGGTGTYNVLTRRGSQIAAAAPICGGWAPERATDFARVPIWIVHGDRDPTVAVRWSRDMVAALRILGAPVTYRELKGVGHNSWTRAYAEPAFWSWLFEQRLPEGGRR